MKMTEENETFYCPMCAGKNYPEDLSPQCAHCDYQFYTDDESTLKGCESQ